MVSGVWALALVALFAIGPSVVTNSDASAAGQSSYSLMSTNDAPPSDAFLGGGCWVLGVKLHTSQAGTVTTLRWYASAAGETARGRVSNASGTYLVDVTFPTSTAAGWTSVTLPTPVAISANTDFWISYWSYSGRFYQGGTYAQPSSGPLSIVGEAAGTNIQFPNMTWGSQAATTNYWIDLNFVPLAPPGAPTSVSAFPANESATVAWTAPASAGATSITGYTVTSSPTGASCTVTGTNAICTGLTNGTGYTFRVRAVNSIGDSEDSSASNSITPQVFTNASLLRGYIPPNFTLGGDNPLSLGLRLTTSSAGEITAIRFFKHIENTGLHTAYVWNNSGTIIGQQDFSSETSSGWQQVSLANPVRVTANSTFTVGYHLIHAGWGYGSFPRSASGPLTVVGGTYNYTSSSGQFPNGLVDYQYAIDLDFASFSVPGSPTSVTATGGNARAVIDWSAPSDNGGSAITGYTVTSSPSGASCVETGTAAVCTGLTNGTAYRFSVKATNIAGDSVASSFSSAVTPATVPGAPTAVTASAGNARATVDWNAPSSNGGAPITTYTVTSLPTGAACSVSGTAATCTGLSNGTSYRFTVKATNSAGDSAASNASASITPSAPLPPPPPEADSVATPTPTRAPPSQSPPSPPSPPSDATQPPPSAPLVLRPVPSSSPTRPLVLAPNPKASTSAAPGATPNASLSGSAAPNATPGVTPSPGAAGPRPLSPSADPVAAAKVFAAAAAAAASPDAPPVPVAVPEGGIFGGDTGGPQIDVELGLSVGEKAAGAPVSIQATDLQPNSPVQVVVHSDPQVIATSQVSDLGEIAIETLIPSGLPAGIHTVVVQAIGSDGQPVQILSAMQIDENGFVTGVAPPAEAAGVAPDAQAMARALDAGKPLYDVSAHPAAVATIAAAGATIAAVAGAAGAAGSAAAGAGSQSGSSGGQSAGHSPSHEQQQEVEKGKTFAHRKIGGAVAATTIEATHEGGHEHHGHVFRPRNLAGVVVVGAALGDSSQTWRLPLTDAFHDGIDKFTAKVGRYSLILPRAIADGAWARAMFGSGAQLLWLAGIAVGLLSLMQTGFQALPASTGLLLAIMALGILDAMAGFLAWAVIFVGALFTGHIREVPDIRASVGLALIAMTLSMLANYVRPLRRSKNTGLGHVFERVADYLIPPIVIAFAAVGMAKSLNGLSGLEIISHDETFAIQIVAGLAVIARLALEDLAVHLYPQRCAAVVSPEPIAPTVTWRIAALMVRTTITILVLSAFIGMNWFTVVLALLLTAPMVLRVWVHRLPNMPNLRRWTPRGLVKLFVMTIVGVYLATWIFKSPLTTPWLPAAMGLLMVPSAIVSIIDTFARSGGDWEIGVWPKRLSGMVIWVLCAGIIMGLIVLVH